MTEILIVNGRLARTVSFMDENGIEHTGEEYLEPENPAAPVPATVEERVASLEEALELLLSGDTGEVEGVENEA